MLKRQVEESKSIEDLIKLIDEGKIVLPEFQRDFKWPIEKTEVLFDSIFKGLFIGSLILSKPGFDLACKDIDKRPRGSKRHKPKAELYKESDFENRNIMALLDGQQRITSIYRALRGPDEVFIVFKSLEELFSEEFYDYSEEEPKVEVEDYIEGFSSNSASNPGIFRISLKDLFTKAKKSDKVFTRDIVDARISEIDRDLSNQQIEVLEAYAIHLRSFFTIEILTESNLLSVQLLDMDLEKFVLYFERSNSQGLNLTFIDIITAKVYVDFKLSNAIEDAKQRPLFNDKLVEPVVRYLNFLENGDVTRKSILRDLTSDAFVNNWNQVINDLSIVQDWLLKQRMVFSLSTLPYRTMLLPILSFYQNLPHKDFAQASEEQLEMLRIWFFSSIYDSRYGGARHGSTNVVIKEDCIVMRDLAKGNYPKESYWDKIRIDISLNEMKRITGNSSPKFLAITYYSYFHKPFLNLENGSEVNFSSKVDVHHILPSNYLKLNFGKDSDEYDLADTILNKAFIPKISNIKYGDKKPSEYLLEISKKNPKIDESLATHLISNPQSLINGNFDRDFFGFIEMRYEAMKILVDSLKESLQKLQSN